MSRLRFVAAVLAFAGVSGFATAHAQQNTQVPQDNLEQPGQIGQPPDSTQINQSERFQARRVPTDTQQQGPTVKEAIVQKLRKANDAEIELAKLAQQKTNNQEVRQLAQTIIQDHQSFNQELEQIGSKQNTASPSGSQTATVPPELCKISEQASQNALKMTKEMLSKYEGQDFNMAYLGQQCVAHTMLLAELKAIQSSGPQELQSVTQQAITKTEKHLEMAKQLAKKFEDDTKRVKNSS